MHIYMYCMDHAVEGRTNNIVLWTEWLDDCLVSIAPKPMNNDLCVNETRFMVQVCGCGLLIGEQLERKTFMVACGPHDST